MALIKNKYLHQTTHLSQLACCEVLCILVTFCQNLSETVVGETFEAVASIIATNKSTKQQICPLITPHLLKALHSPAITDSLPFVGVSIMSVLNSLLGSCPENKKQFATGIFAEHTISLAKLFKSVTHIQLQISIMEFIYRLFPKNVQDRESFLIKLNFTVQKQVLLSIKATSFTNDLRNFLTLLNKTHDGLTSFPLSFRVSAAKSVSTQGTLWNQKSLWVDFNKMSVSVTTVGDSPTIDNKTFELNYTQIEKYSIAGDEEMSWTIKEKVSEDRRIVTLIFADGGAKQAGMVLAKKQVAKHAGRSSIVMAPVAVHIPQPKIEQGISAEDQSTTEVPDEEASTKTTTSASSYSPSTADKQPSHSSVTKKSDAEVAKSVATSESTVLPASHLKKRQTITKPTEAEMKAPAIHQTATDAAVPVVHSKATMKSVRERVKKRRQTSDAQSKTESTVTPQPQKRPADHLKSPAKHQPLEPLHSKALRNESESTNDIVVQDVPQKPLKRARHNPPHHEIQVEITNKSSKYSTPNSPSSMDYDDDVHINTEEADEANLQTVEGLVTEISNIYSEYLSRTMRQVGKRLELVTNDKSYVIMMQKAVQERIEQTHLFSAKIRLMMEACKT